jgi:mannitol 2-dehydrogenase
LGALAGYTYVHEVMHDPGFISLIKSFMDEVTPVVPKISGVSVEDYKNVLIERFANPAIRDQITRICSEGSAKMPKWVLPSVAELLQKGFPTRLLGLVIASWIYYLKQGTNERGEPLEIIDARGAELRERARTAGIDPRPILAVTSIFGQQLPSNEAFVSEVERALDLLGKIGVAATIRRYLSSTGGQVL